jgi:threonine/homoserine/homoserine lactone efflux protein
MPLIDTAPLLSPAFMALLGPLVLFIFANSITPGPNNVMLTASGVTFGFRRTIPHIIGIGFGVAVMLILIGLGVGSLFQRYPAAYTALQYTAAAYLLWLAWKIAHAGPAEATSARSKPMTFMQAAAFQWVNPKAWVMALGIVTTYTPPGAVFAHLALIAAICLVINASTTSIWAAFGTALRHYLRSPVVVRRFNRAMALLLVASLYPILMSSHP